MHDTLRQRLMRHIEALPEEQVYQALDYVEFLSSKYARDVARAPTSLQRFGELLEDKMRGQGLAIGTIRGTLGAVGTANRVFSGIAEAGRTIMREVEQGVKTVADTVTTPSAPPPALPKSNGDGAPAPDASPDPRNP